MVLHGRHVLKRNERQENPGLRGDSVELCLRGDCQVCAQSPASIKNYELISMDNIKFV